MESEVELDRARRGVKIAQDAVGAAMLGGEDRRLAAETLKHVAEALAADAMEQAAKERRAAWRAWRQITGEVTLAATSGGGHSFALVGARRHKGGGKTMYSAVRAHGVNEIRIAVDGREVATLAVASHRRLTLRMAAAVLGVIAGGHAANRERGNGRARKRARAHADEARRIACAATAA